MAKLPNAEAAFIGADKFSAYLLNDAHNVGGLKAAFFKRFGFSVDAPEILESALLCHARQNEAIALPVTVHGSKF